MAELRIRDVPDELVSALEAEAVVQHRSREKQALHLLTEALLPAPDNLLDLPRRNRILRELDDAEGW